MKAQTTAQMLANLGVTKTHSRPHTSNDNAFSESAFKTLKYQPEFPDRFGCQQDTVVFCRSFFNWYNEEHHHSALGLMTPDQIHYGQADAVIADPPGGARRRLRRSPRALRRRIADPLPPSPLPFGSIKDDADITTKNSLLSVTHSPKERRHLY